MKFEMEANDVQVIAEKVAELLGPLLSRKQSADDDEILDVQGLAVYLKVSPKWIYERTHLKEIPHIKAGGQLRFRRKAVDKWLDSYGVPAVNKTTSLKALAETA